MQHGGRRAGRRPGTTQTKEQILRAARDLFARKGYEGATMRTIAEEAGVTAAMVNHFFGSKEHVFSVALNLPVAPSTIVSRVLEGPRDQAGVRMVRIFLELWHTERSRQSILALLRSVVLQEKVAQLMREVLEGEVLEPIAQGFNIPRASLAAAAAQGMGLVLARHIIEFRSLATTEEHNIVNLVVPVLQYYVDQAACLDAKDYEHDTLLL